MSAPTTSYISHLTSLLVTGALPPPCLSLSTLTPARLFSSSLIFFKSFPLLLPVLSFINAPHGRFALPSSALNLPGTLTWFLMEVWSPLLFLLSFLSTTPLTDDVKLDSLSAWTSQLLTPSLSKLTSLPLANVVLGSCFLIHYLHRAIIQPYRSPPRSPIHLSAALSATLFNAQNGFIMGSWLGGTSPSLQLPVALLQGGVANVGSTSLKRVAPNKQPALLSLFSKPNRAVSQSLYLPVPSPGLLPSGLATLLKPLFLLGLVGWGVGLAGNIWHDEVLMNIRKEAALKSEKHDGKPKYGIPYGGLYELISFPNYLCEWFEWFSLSLASLSVLPSPQLSSLPLLTRTVLFISTAPPLIFPLVEVCAMLPRAVNGHLWYKKRFQGVQDGKGAEGYPKTRKAVIPFLL